MNTTPVIPDTSLATAQANVRASSEAQAEHLNENLTSIYLTAFNSWKISVDAGRIDNSNPPKPPVAYVVNDTGGGWYFPVQGDQPVCDMPPIPENMLAPRPPQPLPLPASVRNCLVGDNAPIGLVVTDPDGGRWQKQGVPTPFGPAYYYAKVG